MEQDLEFSAVHGCCGPCAMHGLGVVGLSFSNWWLAVGQHVHCPYRNLWCKLFSLFPNNGVSDEHPVDAMVELPFSLETYFYLQSSG